MPAEASGSGASGAPPSGSRPRWGRYLQWGGTLLLGLYLLRRIDLSGVGGVLAGASAAWVAIAVGVYAVDRLAAAFKWRMLFRASGYPLGLGRALIIYLQGSFIGAAFPATLGADVARAHLVRRRSGTFAHALSSIVAERLLGTLSLVACAVFGFLAFGPGQGRELLASLLLVGGILLLVASLLVTVPRLSGRRVRGTLWERPAEFLGELQTWLRIFPRRPALLASAFTLALTQHYLLILVTWLLAIALGLSLSPVTLLWLWPLVLIAVRLPISVQGFGVREVLLYEYFVRAGLPPEAAVSLGLLSGGVDLLYIAFGGGLLLAEPGGLWRKRGRDAEPVDGEGGDGGSRFSTYPGPVS